jgi:hypothetical protein
MPFYTCYINSPTNIMSTVTKPVSVKAVRSLSAKSPSSALSKARARARESLAAIRSSSATAPDTQTLVDAETLPLKPQTSKYLILPEQGYFLNTDHIVDIYRKPITYESLTDDVWQVRMVGGLFIVVRAKIHAQDFKTVSNWVDNNCY